MSTGAARKPARDLGRGGIEMTAMRRIIGQLAGFAVVGFAALPGPLPLPTPTALPIALPSVSVPTVAVGPPASLPALLTPGDQVATLPTPSQGAQPGTSSDHAAALAGTANTPAPNPPHGIVIPFTTIYASSPLDSARAAPQDAALDRVRRPRRVEAGQRPQGPRRRRCLASRLEPRPETWAAGGGRRHALRRR